MASTNDPKKFRNNIERRGKFLVANAVSAVRRAALAADTAAVLNTPVDTGRARSNWIVTSGAPSNRSNLVFGASKNRDANRAAATAQALAQGAKEIGAYARGSIFLTNNVTYIGLLDQGSSKQAPSGMVGFALAAARREALRFQGRMLKKGR